MKTWDDFQTLLWYALVGLILSVFVSDKCNLLALEDKTARSLGVNVTASRFLVSGIAVLLASISTAVIGPISFLGLIVPHIARLLVGSNHKVLIPYSVILGDNSVCQICIFRKVCIVKENCYGYQEND